MRLFEFLYDDDTTQWEREEVEKCHCRRTWLEGTLHKRHGEAIASRWRYLDAMAWQIKEGDMAFCFRLFKHEFVVDVNAVLLRRRRK